MDNLISRNDAIEVIKAMINVSDSHDRYLLSKVWDQLKDLSSADHCADEWCTDCKEYDRENHCCPRFKRVIKQTVQNTGKWEPIESEVWGYTAVYGYKCSCCGGSANTDSLFLLPKYCPNCGARMVEDD